jgi:hypothetical protein
MFSLDSPKFLELCQRRFHPGTRAKGEQLRAGGLVLTCETSRLGAQYEIAATVQGGAAEPYEIDISCGIRFNTVYLDAKCTCPMLENCKHCYAALLQAMDEDKGGIPLPPLMPPSNVVPLPVAAPRPELTPEEEPRRLKPRKPPRPRTRRSRLGACSTSSSLPRPGVPWRWNSSRAAWRPTAQSNRNLKSI